MTNKGEIKMRELMYAELMSEDLVNIRFIDTHETFASCSADDLERVTRKMMTKYKSAERLKDSRMNLSERKVSQQLRDRLELEIDDILHSDTNLLFREILSSEKSIKKIKTPPKKEKRVPSKKNEKPKKILKVPLVKKPLTSKTLIKL